MAVYEVTNKSSGVAKIVKAVGPSQALATVAKKAFSVRTIRNTEELVDLLTNAPLLVAEDQEVAE